MTRKRSQNGTKIDAKICPKTEKGEKNVVWKSIKKSMQKQAAIPQRLGGSAGGAGRPF